MGTAGRSVSLVVNGVGSVGCAVWGELNDESDGVVGWVMGDGSLVEFHNQPMVIRWL